MSKLERGCSTEEQSSVYLQEINTLREQLQASREEVRQMQKNDYNSRKKAPTESHDAISIEFLQMFQKLGHWAREYFRIGLQFIDLDKHELFKEHLDKVSWCDIDWLMRPNKLNFSHLVEAVVASVLSQRILLLPFAGCEDNFRITSSRIYEAFLLEGNVPEANKWRASTWAVYERSNLWPQSQHREKYYREIAAEIYSIIGPITLRSFPKSSCREWEQLMGFIRAAGNLAIKLGAQPAVLEVMDKSWFEKSGRAFICDDDRMKGRLGEEDEDGDEDYEVALVLRPGLLKRGNDNAEDYHRSAVWVPAMLELTVESPKQIKILPRKAHYVEILRNWSTENL